MTKEEEVEYKRMNDELKDLERKAKLADDLLPVCIGFIRKVETGGSRSVATYGALKRIITAYRRDVSKASVAKRNRLEEQKNGEN